MTGPLPLVDRMAVELHRRRASPEALFLHRAVRDDLQDRLSLVNKSFRDVVVVTPFPAIWREVFPGARFLPDDETLALKTEEADLVIHAVGLHWANDPVGQLIQCRRALRADGLFLGALLGGQTLTELRSVISDAEIAVSGGLSPRIAPMPEIRDLGGLLQRAGFALPVADTQTLTATYRDLMHLMRDLRAMGETNALHGRLRHPSRRALFERAAALYAEHFPAPGGGIRASFEIIGLAGWTPDASQPKPLRPGSAQTRLAEALGTRETPLRD